ncbi:MAG: PIN domain-containing protein [Candidatus Aminicenantes bacterium]|nr:PIN domain-containing protein [Candidatus Aminicenantes bacterium]
MKPVFLLDSVILIDHLRGLSGATRWLASLREDEAVISPITRAEVLCGGSAGENEAAAVLCDAFDCLPLTAEDATRAAAFKREHGGRLPDAFQAALALGHGLKLVTRNTKDFKERKFHFVEIPYKMKD